MNFRNGNHLVLATLLLGVGRIGARAEEPAPRRATPIIFSAPKSDSVSSNLNQLGTRGSPLTDLESGLTKPFEIFPGRSSDNFRAPPRQFTPPAPLINSKKLKSLMDKAAEQSYLTPDEKEDGLGEGPTKSEDDPFSPTGRKRESRLDRYYDRIDRTRIAPTNQTQNTDWFGDNRDPKEKDDSSLKTPSGLFDHALTASAQSLKQMSNNSPEDARATATSGKLSTRAFGDIFGLSSTSAAQPDSLQPEKATRLDDFKRLIDGPSYAPRNDFNAATPPTVGTSYNLPTPATSVPAPGWPAPKPAAGASVVNTIGLTGTPGKPAALPDFAIGTPSATPSLTPLLTPPPSRTQPPKAEFNVPRPKF
jgi:hypothetical protein